MNSFVALASTHPLTLGIGVTLLMLAIGFVWRARRRVRAAQRGQVLVAHAMAQRGLGPEAIAQPALAHAVDEAQSCCAHCHLQRRCLALLPDKDQAMPSDCPNLQLFDRLTDRIQAPAMRRYTVAPRAAATQR